MFSATVVGEAGGGGADLAIYAGGRASSFDEAVGLARSALAGGRAAAVLGGLTVPLKGR